MADTEAEVPLTEKRCICAADFKIDPLLPKGLADLDSTSSFLNTSLGSVFFRPLEATNSLIFLSSTSSVMFSSTCHEAVLRTSVSSFDL
jgi:hypothetical protein